jgi:hypothetical protein
VFRCDRKIRTLPGLGPGHVAHDQHRVTHQRILARRVIRGAAKCLVAIGLGADKDRRGREIDANDPKKTRCPSILGGLFNPAEGD